MPNKRDHWEEKYGAPERSTGTASAFLASLLPELPPGRALDIASGDGRHALALARSGYAVTAIDFARSALRRLRAQAAAEGLAVDTIQADLESYPLAKERYQVAVKVFYLQRSLFAPMKAALSPGGVAVVETFLIDQREIGHPRNPNFLLERGELSAVFSDFEILVAEEGMFDTGRERAYLSRIAARKPIR